MFWKLAFCVLGMGVFGCSLLAMRQARLQAAHELAQTQLRIRASDEKLFKLRSQIGFRVRPEDVRAMVAQMTTLKPMTAPPETEGAGSGEASPLAGEKQGAPGTGTKKPSAKPGAKQRAQETEPTREAAAPSEDDLGGERDPLLAIEDGDPDGTE